MTRPYLRGPNTTFSHWPKPMHEMIKIDINVTINMVESKVGKKLDEIIALIKSQGIDAAKLAALEQKMEAHTDKLKQALETGQQQ